MFCKPPHPVYIVLFRGDDTDFVGNQEIIVKITTERNISGCKAYFKYMGSIQTFDEIPEDKELHLVFSREQTKEMPLGTWDAELYLIDENGKRMTVNNRIHMLVTNSVREAYFPDDTQAVSVVISANKYIEDAEVSADGKTLTLTKKDGTEVSFSGGGGSGGTNDYNDLENKPSINGTTLTGNVNLATPEQLSLKADKSTTLAGYGITDAATKTELDAVDQRAANAFSYLESNLALKADKSALDNHEGDTKNPHKVTAAQVGALPLTGGTLTGDLVIGTEAKISLNTPSDDNGANVNIGAGSSGGGSLNVAGGHYSGGIVNIGGSTRNGFGGTLTVKGGVDGGGVIEVTGSGASIRKNGKEVATEEQVNAKADKATTLAGYGITDAATKTELNAKADKSALAAKADKSTTLAGYGITDGATKTELAALTAKVEYPLYAVPSTGVLKDRAINTTSIATVTVPDNFTDLLIRASVASSLSVTMPEAITTKYGDTFPGEAGEYIITITKTGAAEAYVRTIKLEVANA